MKREKHPVDDFFKNALQGYQVKPRDEQKQRFIKEIETIRTSGNRTRFPWLLFIGGLAVIGTALLFLLNQPHQADHPIISTTLSSFPESGFPTHPTSAPTNSFINEPPSTALPLPTTEAMEVTPITAPPILSEIPIEVIPNDPSPVMISSQPTEDAAARPSPERQPNPDVEEAFHRSPDSLSNPSETLPEDDTVPVTEQIPSSDKGKKRAETSDWKFATSVYYAPEWMFNTLEGNKFVSNFGLEENFRYGRYSVRTGIGLSITKGTNELVVEYNDFLGSYQQLDSMSFSWDEQHYHLIPSYYLSNQDVWDSLIRLDYPRIIKRYTYLQIPLILGYDIIQKKRFSFGFRAGPLLSILINTTTLSGNYDPGKNRIVQVNQVTPDRIQTNWQIMAGINLSLPVWGRVTLELEPEIKYYFNSVYEKSSITKKPWSLGLRASVRIRNN